MIDGTAAPPRARGHRLFRLVAIAVVVGFVATFAALQFRPWHLVSPGGGSGQELAVEHATLQPGLIVLTLGNHSDNGAVISQAIVNDSYVDFHALNARGTELAIDYPWIEGESYEIELLTPSGSSVDFEIEEAGEAS